MNRAVVLDHLSKARRHVEEGERSIERQRELILHKESRGLDTSYWRELLSDLEEMQRWQVEHRDRIERRLATLSQRWSVRSEALG